MFREWGFLITEMVLLLVLAALLGLLVGWVIWGRRENDASDSSALARLRADLDGCRTSGREKDRRIAELEQGLEASNTKILSAAAALVEGDEIDFDLADQGGGEVPDYDGDGVLEGMGEGVKPVTLPAARDGGPDDLKRIKGIGPKLEQLCHGLGFYHFDQVAAWTDQEVAWVDANLEGFRGRVTRDGWVAQARLLASGGETDFSKRVDDGDVYG